MLRAYEHDRDLPCPALLVLGPFMRSSLQAEFMARVSLLERVHAITFEANVENLMAAASGIVAMGGYNTLCEILSFDKPALIVPRTEPRLEQYIRASRAQALGLIRMLDAGSGTGADRMAAALRDLPSQPKPSEVRISGLLDGLDVIGDLVDRWLGYTGHPGAQALSGSRSAPEWLFRWRSSSRAIRDSPRPSSRTRSRALERRGLDIRLYSMRSPTDPTVHPVHGEIAASVSYLPEYLHQQPRRVFRAWRTSGAGPGIEPPVRPTSATCGAIRRATASAASGRRWFWRRRCPGMLAGCMPISCTRRRR